MSDYAYLLHEPADGPRAAVILQALRAAKLDVRGDAPLTGDPDAATAAEIDGAWVAIPLWSEHSTARDGPQLAYRAAEAPAQRGAYLGVLLDGVPPPFGFGGLQAVDLAKWSGRSDAQLQALAETVRQRLRSGPAGDMPSDEQIAGAGRRRRGVVVAALLAVLLAGAIGVWRYMATRPTQRQRIDLELAAIPCSWLQVDPVDDGAHGTLALTGVADDPERAGQTIRGLVRGQNIVVTTDRVARIASNDCPAIDVPRAIRQDSGGRLRMIDDTVGRDPSSRLAPARIQLHFRGGDRSMALFGMEPNGTVTQIFSSFADIAKIKDIPNIGYTHDDSRSYEFTLPATHIGWTGLLLVTGTRSLPVFAGVPNAEGDLMQMNSHAFADYLGKATGGGQWQAEMAWYRIQPR